MTAKKSERPVPITGYAVLAIRDAWKLTQEDFAEVLGVSREWVSRAESAQTGTMRRGTLKKLADAMGISPDDAFRLLLKLVFKQMNPDIPAAQDVQIPPPHPNAVGDFDRNVGGVVSQHQADIPTFELSLAAGPWSDVLDVPDICDPGSIAQRLFRVRISGDSMRPLYRTGMVIEFECLVDGLHALQVHRDYYVQRDDGTATFKRLDGLTDDLMTLRALNRKKFPKPITVERSRIVRMAVARGEFKSFD